MFSDVVTVPCWIEAPGYRISSNLLLNRLDVQRAVDQRLER